MLILSNYGLGSGVLGSEVQVVGMRNGSFNISLVSQKKILAKKSGAYDSAVFFNKLIWLYFLNFFLLKNPNAIRLGLSKNIMEASGTEFTKDSLPPPSNPWT